MHSNLQNDRFLERLEQELKSKPTWEKQKFREESWMTSLEIAEWYATKEYEKYTEDEIENILLQKWESNSLINIRPAKYPHSGNFRTLWGHIDVVYPQKNKIEPRKTDPAFYYSQNKLPANSPIVFLSHSLSDSGYAIKVSKKINKVYRYRTWLCEESLNINDVISHEIRESIAQSDAVVVLLTYKSLGSAYVHTEALTADKQEIPLIIFIKSDDNDIMEIVEMHEKNPSLSTLIEKYKKIVKDEHRISVYKKNAINILNILQNGKPIFIYPALPVNYTKNRFKAFDKEFEVKKRTS
jgi:hypothetical protein